MGGFVEQSLISPFLWIGGTTKSLTPRQPPPPLQTLKGKPLVVETLGRVNPDITESHKA